MKHVLSPLQTKIKLLQDHILRVAREEPYMGEGIPLRWLKFEKAKAARNEGMLNMSQVYFLVNRV